MTMHRLLYGLSTICVVVSLMVLIWLRVSHPDMTSTRFFLTYWPLIPVLLGVAGGYVAVRRK